MQKQFLIMSFFIFLLNISASAHASLYIGQRVHFKDNNTHHIGNISAFTDRGLILVMAHGQRYYLRESQIGTEVVCLGHLCQGNPVEFINYNTYYRGLVHAIFDDRIVWVKNRNTNHFVPLRELSLWR